MSRRLFILDLDRTLFDTSRFSQDIITALQRTHQLDVEKFRESISAFIDPESGGYDPHGHHERLLGLPAGELDELLARELGEHDYLFPDAAAWLASKRADPDTELTILTIGRQRFQELKLSHARAAVGLPMLVIPKDKANMIRQKFLGTANTQVTLIDDAADVFADLAGTPGITLIRIARPGEKYSDVPTPSGVRQITNFGEL